MINAYPIAAEQLTPDADKSLLGRNIYNNKDDKNCSNNTRMFTISHYRNLLP